MNDLPKYLKRLIHKKKNMAPMGGDQFPICTISCAIKGHLDPLIRIVKSMLGKLLLLKE